MATSHRGSASAPTSGHPRSCTRGFFGRRGCREPSRTSDADGAIDLAEDNQSLREVGKFPARASHGRARSALAGAAAAAVWALQEPLDRRLIGCDYSDVAVLGKALTSGRAWWPAGFAMHVANGALFGLAYHEARRRWPVRPRTLGVGLALGEHAALYPLCYFVDRFHPQRGATGVPPLLKNHKAFMQATWRHTIFGLVLARLT